MNTPVRIINICAIFIIFFVFCLGFTWIGYRLEETPYPLKESVTSTASLLTILATLTAAYVASKLFNDWRAQHNKSVRNEFSLEAYRKFTEFDHCITLCAFNIDSLQDTIANANYHITPGSPEYIDLLPELEKMMDSLNLVKINYTNYLHAQRAYGVVTAQSNKISNDLSQYIDDYSKITNKSLKDFKNVQELLNNAKDELTQFSELAVKIYHSNISEILHNLQVEDQTS